MNKLQIRNNIFYIICICLPFLFIPKRLQLNFIGGPIGSELVVYPILLSFIVMIYCYFKNEFIFYDMAKFKKYIIIYVTILSISLLFGLIYYPYYHLIINGPLNQIKGTTLFVNFLSYLGINCSQTIIFISAMVMKSIKNIFLEIIYTFGVAYIVYCWFKEDFNLAIKIMTRAATLIIVLMILYSCIEIPYLIGFEWAKNILKDINPFLHAIKANFNWWPPLLWPGKMRNFFPEPSQFGMYGNFIVPFLWLKYFREKESKASLLLIFALSLFLFLSRSKTAIVLIIIENLLLFVFSTYVRSMVVMRKWFNIILVTILAFILSGFLISNFDSIKNVNTLSPMQRMEKFNNTMTAYGEDNIVGAAKEHVGSNDARFAIIKSDFRVGVKHWLFGVGLDLKTAYNNDNFTEKERRNPEIANCYVLQQKEGLLKTGYPSPCEYSRRFAETGVIGLLVYLYPIIFLFYMILRKWKVIVVHKYFETVCMVISLIGILISGFSSSFTVFESYWILLGILYSLVSFDDKVLASNV